jgi:hypothetical protein
MTESLRRIQGENVLVCGEEGPPLRGEQEALDLIGQAVFLREGEDRADWVVIPVERFDDGFFQLSTGVAGAILQRLAMYRIRVAVVGDISRYTAASSAFNDFVFETNRGAQAWFLSTMDDFESRLAALKTVGREGQQ